MTTADEGHYYVLGVTRGTGHPDLDQYGNQSRMPDHFWWRLDALTEVCSDNTLNNGQDVYIRTDHTLPIQN